MKLFVALTKSAVIFFAVALAAAMVLLAFNRWFGAGDLRAFAWWTALLSVAVSFLSVGQARLVARWNICVALSLSFVIGAFLGYLGTLLVELMLGAWFMAFSFPVFDCWVAGAAIACVAATFDEKKRRRAEPRVAPLSVGGDDAI
jgi:hypothetical protein